MSRAKSKNFYKPKINWAKLVLLYIISFFFIAGVVVVVYSVAYKVRHEHREVGQYNVSDTYVGEDLFRSLDLKVAAKAHYASKPLTAAKDLGYANDLHQQLFKFSVADEGLTEYGLMITPPGAMPAGGYPVVILLHGYANSDIYHTAAGYIADMEFYAQHGFLVLKPDLRGQGYSLDSGHSDSAYFSMAYNTDLMSLISALKQTKYVDKTNINLWGHSMGAYLALRAAILSKDIKNIILVSGPVDSLYEMYFSYIPPSDEDNAYALATRNNVFSKYGTPAENSRFWYDASPINFVSQTKAHIQIHVGLLDGTVPPLFSADLNTALSKAHISHQYFAYPEGRHALVPERPEIYGASLQLMQTKATIPQT